MIDNGNKLISNGDNKMAEHKTDNNSLAALIYTSGTTGTSKGVMLSQKNLASNAVGACKLISFPESFLLILPLHHIFALSVGVLTIMLQGTSIAINQSLKNIQGDMQKYKPRNIFMVPLLAMTFYKQIMALAKGNNDIENLRKIANMAFGGNLTAIGCGSAPIDVKYINGYRELGMEFVEGYGLTESAGIASVNRNKYYRDGSIGLVPPSCEVKIAEPNEIGHGEICIKGNIVMLGYYRNEQATKDVFDDEWFKTGDIGYIDEDGFLYISGRKKNLIILSNGKNVYPEEIEFALCNSFSYIKEVVVYEDNDMITAEVFLDTENIPDCISRLDNDIIEFNRTQPIFKNIGKTIVRETEFPKTTSRKIKRQYK